MAAMTCLLSLWSVSALPVPHREEGEARGGREGQEGKELTKSHGIVDVDCLYVVSKFVRTRSCHSCGKEGGSDWLRLHFKGDSQFKAGPPLPPGFTSTSMPPQKKKIIFGSVFAFFSHFFWGANSEWGFPTSMPPAEKFFIFDSIITLFRPFFFWDELGVGFSCLSNDLRTATY